MDQQFLDEGERNPTLGPHYFAARKAAEDFMAHFEAEHFAPLIKKFADEMYGQLHSGFEDHLLSDVESNLQGTIWRQIDDSVKALLSGEKWAIDRYVLGERYDDPKIRAAIALLIPEELQDARVKDLEVEIAELRKNLEWARRR